MVRFVYLNSGDVFGESSFKQPRTLLERTSVRRTGAEKFVQTAKSICMKNDRCSPEQLSLPLLPPHEGWLQHLIVKYPLNVLHFPLLNVWYKQCGYASIDHNIVRR